MATSGSLYNWSRSTRQILRRNRKSPASFYLHLHPTWFRFEDAKGRLLLEEPVTDDTASGAGPSRGAKTGTPGRELLQCIRDQTLPNYALDVLDSKRVTFFDGCLIVEIKDHRPPIPPAAPRTSSASQVERCQAKEPELNPASLAARIEGGRYGNGSASVSTQSGTKDSKSVVGVDKLGGAAAPPHGSETFRVVLRPNETSLWTDLRSLNEKLSGGTWSEEEALEVESSILTLTSAPLCLTPDPHATRIANLMAAATAPVSAYAPLQPLSHHRALPPIETSPIQEPQAEEEEASKETTLEEQREDLERNQREAIMRIMEHGWRVPPDKQNGSRSSQATVSSSPAVPFLPSFQRLTFIERYRADRGSNVGESPAAANNKDEAAALEGDDAEGKQEDTKANGMSSNTSTKKGSSKKRKKQEGETAAEEESEKPKEEETPAAPKKKKKKTATATAATQVSAASPLLGKEASKEETPSKGKKSGKTVPDAEKKKTAKGKSKGKNNSTEDNAEADVARTPAAEALASSVIGETEAVAVHLPSGGKGSKKAPAAKKSTTAGGTKAKKAQPAVGPSPTQRTGSISAAKQVHPSPTRPSAASPFVPGTAPATPSPATSQRSVMGAPAFGGLPLGVGLPLIGNSIESSPQQQQMAAMAAYYNNLQQAGLNGNGRQPAGAALNLPFGQSVLSQNTSGLAAFPNQQINAPMHRTPTMSFTPQQQQAQVGGAGGGGGALQIAQLAQLQQNPSLIHSLPPAIQAQLLHQLNAAATGAGKQVPTGWPPGQ